MGRENYRYIGQDDFRGGINQEPENAQPNQVLDALNVWCPNGVVEHRPSFKGIPFTILQAAGSASSIQLIKEDNTTSTPSYSNVANITGTYVSKTNTRTGDRIYMGFNGYTLSTTGLASIEFTTASPNAANTLVKVEVFTDSGWVTLEHGNGSSMTPENVTLLKGNAFFTGNQNYRIPWVNNAASTTVNGVTRSVWVRFEFLNADLIMGANTITMSPATTLGIGSYAPIFLKSSSLPGFYGISTFSGGTSTQFFLKNLSGEDIFITYPYDFPPGLVGFPSLVEIPQFGDAIFSVGSQAFTAQLYAVPSILSPTGFFTIGNAKIEDRPEFVGTVNGIKSDFHPDIIAQLSAWPSAKFYMYHQGTLFAANVIGDNQIIRWSAPEPAYKVWPSESFAYFISEDRSEITGLAVLNENVIVFKQDSIWQLVDIGEDDLGLRQFTPRLIKQGIGCVSNNSIQNIPGGLVFLAEDGIYFCDGTPNVKKLSQPIDLTTKTINSSFRYLATSTHIRSGQCYVLSVPTDGNTYNNLTLVYDYKHNGWWKWDGITPQSWFSINSQFNTEEVYFLDHTGQLMQMEKTYSGNNYFEMCATTLSGNTTGGSYILSHRIGYGSNTTKLWGDITVDGNARMSCEAHILVQDEDPPASAVNLSFTDTSEDTWGGADQWGTAVWVKSKRRNRRLSYRKHGEWAQFRVENFGAGAQLKGVQLGYIPLGIR